MSASRLAPVQPCGGRGCGLAPIQLHGRGGGKGAWPGPNPAAWAEGGIILPQPDGGGGRNRGAGIGIWRQGRLAVLMATASLTLNFPTPENPHSPNAMAPLATFGMWARS